MKARRVMGTVLAVLTAVFMSTGAINVQTVFAGNAARAMKSQGTWEEFATVQAAVDSLKGYTGAVELLANVTESIVIPNDAYLTLNLNGYNITNVK